MLKRKIRHDYSLGIDLGGTKIAAGLCEGAKIIRKVVLPTSASTGFEGVVDVMAQACRNAMADVNEKDVSGIGVGAAGQVDSKTGVVLYAPNLKWKNAPLGEALSMALKMPVRVVNDVRAATLAEWKFGAGKGFSCFANIFLGTGIGSGFVMNGALLEGVTNSAGEIGHICLDPEGPVCGCGHKGCLEAFSSGRGIETEVKRRLARGEGSSIRDLVADDLKKVSALVIGKAAREGDSMAIKVLRESGAWLGLALANVHTMLNPQIIILGGGLMALKEFFLPEARVVLHRHVLPVADRGNELLVEAHFATEAALIGSAALFS